MTDIALAIRYGAPHLPPRPDSVTVVEWDIRRMTVRVDGSDWWVVLRSVDGIVVEIPGDLIRDAHPIDRPARCDFIAAVETECDGIFIPRAELPEVEDAERGSWRFSTGASLTSTSTKTAEDARTEARELLALAEHLDAHPPVDEAQVEALAAALIDAEMDGADGPTPYTVAYRLLRSGRIEVKP